MKNQLNKCEFIIKIKNQSEMEMEMEKEALMKSTSQNEKSMKQE